MAMEGILWNMNVIVLLLSKSFKKYNAEKCHGAKTCKACHFTWKNSSIWRKPCDILSTWNTHTFFNSTTRNFKLWVSILLHAFYHNNYGENPISRISCQIPLWLIQVWRYLCTQENSVCFSSISFFIKYYNRFLSWKVKNTSATQIILMYSVWLDKA